MMVRRRRKGNTAWYAAMLVIAVAAFLILKGDVHFLRLAVISVPQEGVTYDFDDGTFQGWTVTSEYITVENGVVAAGAPGAGGGGTGTTYTYTFNTDNDFEGWSIYRRVWSSGSITWGITVQDGKLKIYFKGTRSDGNMYEFEGYV
jgi:hypothetical protein